MQPQVARDYEQPTERSEVPAQTRLSSQGVSPEAKKDDDSTQRGGFQKNTGMVVLNRIPET